MSEIKTKIVAKGKVANICLCGVYDVKGSLGMHKKHKIIKLMLIRLLERYLHVT